MSYKLFNRARTDSDLVAKRHKGGIKNCDVIGRGGNLGFSAIDLD